MPDGRAMFRCPSCAVDSGNASFDADQKKKRMQCKACLHIDSLHAFQAPIARPGIISDNALFFSGLGIAAAYVIFKMLSPANPHSFPNAESARTAGEAWAELSHAQGVRCASALTSRGVDESMYEKCMGVYSIEK